MAITLVVLCHAAESVYWNEGNLSTSLGWALFHYLGRLGVPLFLFLTGALVLSKNFNAAGIKRFYQHNFLGLLITIEVWVFIYNIYFWLIGSEVTFESWLKMAVFIEQVPLSHWWYMPLILSIYLVLPFVGLVLRNLDSRVSKALLVIVIVVAFVLPTAGKYYAAQLHLEPFETPSILSYLGYMAYVVMGYFLFHKKFLGSINKWLIAFVLVLSSWFAIDVCRQPSDLWYDSVWVFISACCLAEFARRLCKKFSGRLHEIAPKATNFITTISKGAFGIYLIHIPVRDFIDPSLACISLDSLRCVCLFICTWLLSVAFICCVFFATRKAPKLRRVLLDA